MKGIFGIPMWQLIMAGLNEDLNIQRNCIKLGIGYHYKYFKELEKLGFIELLKDGRNNKIKFTPSGIKVRNLCCEILLISKSIEERSVKR